MGIKVHHPNDTQYAFRCHGCGYAHVINNTWGWNGSDESPTFTPSILCQGEKRCHSFVTDGKIRFLSDCDHELAGQTVELPDWRPFCDDV